MRERESARWREPVGSYNRPFKTTTVIFIGPCFDQVSLIEINKSLLQERPGQNSSAQGFKPFTT